MKMAEALQIRLDELRRHRADAVLEGKPTQVAYFTRAIHKAYDSLAAITYAANE